MGSFHAGDRRYLPGSRFKLVDALRGAADAARNFADPASRCFHTAEALFGQLHRLNGVLLGVATVVGNVIDAHRHFLYRRRHRGGSVGLAL